MYTWKLCFPAGGNHGDIDGATVLLFAKEVCGIWQKQQTTFGKSSAPLTHSFPVGNMAYDYKISWKDGCDHADVDFVEPNGKGVSPDCSQLLYNAYKQCKCSDYAPTKHSADERPQATTEASGGDIFTDCLLYEFSGHNK